MIIEKKKDYGKIDFGKHEGKNWNDLPLDYLQYLVKDECYTSDHNKEIAQKILDQYNVIDNQVPLFQTKGRRYEDE